MGIYLASAACSNLRPEVETMGAFQNLTNADREVLREIAVRSINHGLQASAPLDLDLREVSAPLREKGATFVTLTLSGQLRGCVGSLEAIRPVAQDVALNAHSAAFRDYRFPPLSLEELSGLELHISVLTPVEAILVENREALLRTLRPGVDGLLLEDPPHRSTFLPQVWESVPEPEDFLGELLMKAGLQRDHWSATLRFFRYAVEEF